MCHSWTSEDVSSGQPTKHHQDKWMCTNLWVTDEVQHGCTSKDFSFFYLRTQTLKCKVCYIIASNAFNMHLKHTSTQWKNLSRYATLCRFWNIQNKFNRSKLYRQVYNSISPTVSVFRCILCWTPAEVEHCMISVQFTLSAIISI